MEKPICKQCESDNKKYTVQMPMYGTTTLMAFTPGYWDEDGKYIENENPNKTTFIYQCSNGHSWSN